MHRLFSAGVAATCSRGLSQQFTGRHRTSNASGIFAFQSWNVAISRSSSNRAFPTSVEELRAAATQFVRDSTDAVDVSSNHRLTSRKGVHDAGNRSKIDANEHRSVDFPRMFSLDAEAALVTHTKELYTSADNTKKFAFECTKCGACCRSFADTVMLDPYDVYLMHSVFPTSVEGGVLSMRPQSFTHGLGKFTAAALPPHLLDAYSAFLRQIDSPLASSADSLPPVWYDPVYDDSDRDDIFTAQSAFGLPPVYASLQRLSGVAPVVHLRSLSTGRSRRARVHKRGNIRNITLDLSQESNSPIVFEDDADRQCTFAVQATSDTGKPGLTCSLGPAAMPGSCALYPMGELLSAGDTDFVTLDSERCEGFRVKQSGSNVHTVASYRETRGLQRRKLQHDWFMALVTSVAVQQYDQRVAASFEAMVHCLADMNADESNNVLSALRGASLRCLEYLPLGDAAFLATAVSSSMQALHTGKTSADLIATLIQNRLRYVWYGHPALHANVSWDAAKRCIEDDTIRECKQLHNVCDDLLKAVQHARQQLLRRPHDERPRVDGQNRKVNMQRAKRQTAEIFQRICNITPAGALT